MNAALRRLVVERAGERCEYCWLPLALHPAPFQVDHIRARQHGGSDDPGNLALACIHCNRHKGPNIAGVDPETGVAEPLFHPRQDQWLDHFFWSGPILRGLTPVGRATVHTLAINARELVDLRRALAEESLLQYPQ